MKYTIVLFLMFSSFCISAQNKYIGCYNNYFAERIKINADSTFLYEWRFHTGIYSFTSGKWKVVRDTLFFKMIPSYDTIVYKKNGVLVKEEIVLSDYNNGSGRKIDSSEYFQFSYHAQNSHRWPNKLFYRKEKLFEIKANGKLIRKKRSFLLRNKKYVPWYHRCKDD